MASGDMSTLRASGLAAIVDLYGEPELLEISEVDPPACPSLPGGQAFPRDELDPLSLPFEDFTSGPDVCEFRRHEDEVQRQDLAAFDVEDAVDLVRLRRPALEARFPQTRSEPAFLHGPTESGYSARRGFASIVGLA
jgi:hypothetical protein